MNNTEKIAMEMLPNDMRITDARLRDQHANEILGWRNKWKCAVELAALATVERDEARKSAETAKSYKRGMKLENQKLKRQLAAILKIVQPS